MICIFRNLFLNKQRIDHRINALVRKFFLLKKIFDMLPESFSSPGSLILLYFRKIFNHHWYRVEIFWNERIFAFWQLNQTLDPPTVISILSHVFDEGIKSLILWKDNKFSEWNLRAKLSHIECYMKVKCIIPWSFYTYPFNSWAELLGRLNQFKRELTLRTTYEDFNFDALILD